MGRGMTYPWSSTRCWLAGCLAAAGLSAAHAFAAEPQTSSSPAIQGEMVNDDAPATYRLPLIGLCDPAEEARVTGASGRANIAKPQAAVVGTASASATAAAGVSLPFPAGGGLT